MIKDKLYNKTLPSETRQIFIPIYCQHLSTMKLRNNGIVLSGISHTTPGFQIQRILDAHLVIITLEGEGVFKSNESSFNLSEKSILLAPAHIEHFYRQKGNKEWKFLWFHLTPTEKWHFLNIENPTCSISKDAIFLENSIKSLIMEVFSLHQESIDAVSSEYWYSDCYNLERAMQKFDLPILPTRMYASELAELCAMNILFYLERELRELLNCKQYSEGDLLLDNLWKKVNSTLDQKWSLSRMAKTVNMSVPTFIRQVKKLYNSTPIALLQHIRMRHAKLFLIDTKLSINLIAEKTGYKNTSSFIMIFKKYFKCTPLKYREQLTNKEDVLDRH